MKLFALKFLSLGFALVLWFYVVSAQKIEVVKKASLLINTPPKYGIVNIIPENIEITLKGSRLLLNELSKKLTIKSFVSQSVINKAKRNIKLDLKKAEINLPLGIELLSTTPKSINLIFGKRIKKWLVPKITLTSESRSNYKIKKIYYSSNKVLVEGVYPVLKSMNNYTFRTIDIEQDNIESNSWINISNVDNFKISDNRIHLLSKTLKIKIDYRDQGSKLNFLKQNIYYLSKQNNYIILQKYADVELFVPKEYNLSLINKKIRIYADIPDDAKGLTKIHLKAFLPENIELINIIPSDILINIK